MMIMGTSTSKAPKNPDPIVQRFEWSGTYVEINHQVMACVLPEGWGPGTLVKDLILSHVPIGGDWRGRVTAVGYRTWPHDVKGGTVYVSVNWKQEVITK